MLRLCLGLILVCACSGKTLVVESDTSWSGTIDRLGTVAGRGGREFGLGGLQGEVCWTLVKTTSLGTLRAYARDETWFGLGAEVDGDASTTAPNGQVAGCAQ
jgi:hypothetical protein